MAMRPQPSRVRGAACHSDYDTTRHHHREPDPLDRVDPLNSETGSIPTSQATLRCCGKLAQAFPEIAVQAHASYAQGKTDLNGYLQSDPYSPRTGNWMPSKFDRNFIMYF